MASDSFNEVLTLIRTLFDKADKHEQKLKILEGFERRFGNLIDEFKNSDGFRTTVVDCSNRLKEISTTNSTLLNPVYDAITPLSNALKKNQKSSVVNNKSSSSTSVEPSTAPKPTTASNNGSDSIEIGEQAATASMASTSGGKAKQKRRLIENLVKAGPKLRNIDKHIKKAGEETLSWDDLDKDDNAFIQHGKLQDKYYNGSLRVRKLEKQLEQITGTKIAPDDEQRRQLDRPTSPPIKYRGSGYDQIDKVITRLIRQPTEGASASACSSIAGFFAPNYADLDGAITKANEQHGLGLTNEAIATLIPRVGTELTKMRKDKTRRNFVEYLKGIEGSEEKPPPSDPVLDKKLEESSSIKEQQLLELVNKRSLAEEEKAGEDECRLTDVSEESDEEENESEEPAGDRMPRNGAAGQVEELEALENIDGEDDDVQETFEDAEDHENGHEDDSDVEFLDEDEAASGSRDIDEDKDDKEPIEQKTPKTSRKRRAETNGEESSSKRTYEAELIDLSDD